MKVLNDILFIFAAVCFLLASFGLSSYAYRRSGTTEPAPVVARSFNPVAFGLFLWAMVYVIAALRVS